MRRMAEATVEEDFRRSLLEIADEYEKLAENTEAQERAPQHDAAN